MRKLRAAAVAAALVTVASAGAAIPGIMATSAASASTGNGVPPSSHSYHAISPLYPQTKAQADAIAQEKATAGGHHGGGGSGGGSGPSLTNPDLGWGGVSQSNLTPGDPTGAMSSGLATNYYMQLVNDQYQYGTYSSSATVTGSGTLATLFASTGVSNSALSDPQVLWDPQTSRFYYVAITTTSGDYQLLYGYTKDANPADGTCSYVAQNYFSTLPDYPKLGDMSGYLLVGVNDFASGNTYSGSQVDWIAKSTGGTCAAQAGAAGQINLTEQATPVPAVEADAPLNDGYVVQAADVSGSASTSQGTLYLTPILPPSSSTSGSPTLGTQAAVTVNPYYLPPSAPQYGTSNKLDTMDGRLEHAVEVGGDIYTAHAVALSSGGRSVEQWYELNTGGGRVSWGDLSDSALYVFNGDISPNIANSGVTLGVTTSGSNAYPAMQAVSGTASTSGASLPSGLTPASTTAAGSVIYQSQTYDADFSCSRSTPCRWGDYSGAYPTDGGVFLTNMYQASTGSRFGAGWATRNYVETTP